MIFKNARVVDPVLGFMGDSFEVRQGRIEQIGQSLRGSNDEVEQDLAGCWVIPGFWDAHLHIIPCLMKKAMVTLRTVRSLEECRSLLLEQSQHTEGWIQGEGLSSFRVWHSCLNREILDDWRISRPICLRTQDGHHAVMNSLACAHIAQRNPKLTVPEDGWWTEESWMEALSLMPLPSSKDLMEAWAQWQQELFSLGVVGVGDQRFPGFSDLEILLEVLAQNPTLLKISLQLDGRDRSLASATMNLNPATMRVGTAKFVLDGTLGARTARNHLPYTLNGSDNGCWTIEPATLKEEVLWWSRQGYSSSIHAIGSEAVRVAHEILQVTPAGACPHRIEHAEVIDPCWWPSWYSSDVILSLQPCHEFMDRDIIQDFYPALRECVFDYNRLKLGAKKVILGSDAPVVAVDPTSNFKALMKSTLDVWDPVRWHTSQAAKALGFSRSGRLLPGYDADFIVLSHKGKTLPDFEQIQVEETWIQGECCFRKETREEDSVCL